MNLVHLFNSCSIDIVWPLDLRPPPLCLCAVQTFFFTSLHVRFSPAYVFHLAEVMAKAGVAEGLPEELAAKLAQATVSGAGELMRLSSDDPAQLRVNVTSPNGTTQAALEVLMAEPGLTELMTRAVNAATERSRELAKQ